MGPSLVRDVGEKGDYLADLRLESVQSAYHRVMPARRIIGLVVRLLLTLVVVLPGRSAQNGGTATKDAPPAVYVDEGACPFECCTYREWTVRKSVTVFDRPNGRETAHLSKGERLKALTGEVISIYNEVGSVKAKLVRALLPKCFFFTCKNLFLLHDQGSCRNRSAEHSVPPPIYSIPTRVGNHDYFFELPDFFGEAGRPLKRTVSTATTK